jgi:hypothetical protein
MRSFSCEFSLNVGPYAYLFIFHYFLPTNHFVLTFLLSFVSLHVMSSQSSLILSSYIFVRLLRRFFA